jgi:hypothetical protein
MKILKILLIVLVPAFGVVSCQKSDIKPRNCQDHEDSAPAVASKNAASSDVNTEDDSSDQTYDHSAKKVGGVVVDSPGSESGTEIIGSGDDDRDGGDKKKKIVR